MISDYKYRAQLIAEEAAMDTYGKDFYDLDPVLQDSLYTQALETDMGRMADIADNLRDLEGSN